MSQQATGSPGDLIVAEAEKLIDALAAKGDAAAQAEAARVALLADAKQAATDAIDAAKGAAGATPVPVQALLDEAGLHLSRATLLAAALAASDQNFKDEWKECRSSIDRFDKILVDLRKTGASFVTAIISGAAFLLAQSPPALPAAGASAPAAIPGLSANAKVVIFAAICVLILGIYFIDRVHQCFLRVAVRRAAELENLLGYRLTGQLSATTKGWLAAAVGVGMYLLFLVVCSALFVFALDPPAGAGAAQGFRPQQWAVEAAAALCCAIILVFTAFTTDAMRSRDKFALGVGVVSFGLLGVWSAFWR